MSSSYCTSHSCRRPSFHFPAKRTLPVLIHCPPTEVPAGARGWFGSNFNRYSPSRSNAMVTLPEAILARMRSPATVCSPMCCYLTGLRFKGDKWANSSVLSYATGERKVGCRSTVLISSPFRERSARSGGRGCDAVIEAMVQHGSCLPAFATHDVIPDLIRDPS